MSANVIRLSLDQIVGPKGNKEFTDLITVMGCNVGPKFDKSKLQFNKIIIASDADVDGFFIRSLLLAFFFKLYPDLIRDGRIYIAEPPLYRIDDKKDPFVINKVDYVDRYVKMVMKDYRLGYQYGDDELKIDWFSKAELHDFLNETSSYADDMMTIVNHYKINDRLLEILFEEVASLGIEANDKNIPEMLKRINIQSLMDRIGREFKELEYDDNRGLIIGAIDAKQQVVELSAQLLKRGMELIGWIQKWAPDGKQIVLKAQKTSTEYRLSILGIMKMLKRYQPNILHRFKGLGENDDDDLRTTIMDPNTRTLIKVNIGDIENDMKIIQMLRGGSPVDALSRKQMMRGYRIPRDLIDT